MLQFGTACHRAAGRALQERGVPAPVEQQQRLLPVRRARHQGGCRAPRTRARRPPRAPAARCAGRPAPPAAAAAARCGRAGGAAAGPGPRQRLRLERRRGAAEHHARALEPRAHQRDVAGMVARRLAVLVARLVLLVDHDEAEVAHRREDGRARADGDPALAPAQQPPGIGALAVGEPAVQHRDLVAEDAAEPAHRLRRERDLGHQHDRAAPRASACRTASR